VIVKKKKIANVYYSLPLSLLLNFNLYLILRIKLNRAKEVKGGQRVSFFTIIFSLQMFCVYVR